MNFYTGDHVLYNGRDCIVIGSYALLHASDMDFIGENDVRFRDYRVMDIRTGNIPLTWVRDTELTLCHLSDSETQTRAATIIATENIYELIRNKDKGLLKNKE